MKKYFCDRCEKEIKTPKYIYPLAFPAWREKIIDSQCVTSYMLCKNCLLSFANWLGNDFLYNEYNKLEGD